MDYTEDTIYDPNFLKSMIVKLFSFIMRIFCRKGIMIMEGQEFIDFVKGLELSKESDVTGISPANLFKNGFTFGQMICEAVDNSLDAGANRIEIEFGESFIIFRDNGTTFFPIKNLYDGKVSKHRFSQIGIFNSGMTSFTSNADNIVLISLDKNRKEFKAVEYRRNNNSLNFAELPNFTSAMLKSNLNAQQYLGGFSTCIILSEIHDESFYAADFNLESLVQILGLRYYKVLGNNSCNITIHDCINSKNFFVNPVDPTFRTAPVKEIRSLYSEDLQFEISLDDILKNFTSAISTKIKKRIISECSLSYSDFDEKKVDECRLIVNPVFLAPNNFMRDKMHEPVYNEFLSEHPEYNCCKFGASNYSNGFYICRNGIIVGNAAIGQNFSFDLMRQEYNFFRVELEVSPVFDLFVGINLNKSTYAIHRALIQVLEEKLLQKVKSLTIADKTIKSNKLGSALKKAGEYLRCVKDINDVSSSSDSRTDKLVSAFSIFQNTYGPYYSDALIDFIHDIKCSLKNGTYDLENAQRIINDLQALNDKIDRHYASDFNNLYDRIINVHNMCPSKYPWLNKIIPLHEDINEAETEFLLRVLLTKDENGSFLIPEIEKLGIEFIVDYRTEKGLDNLIVRDNSSLETMEDYVKAAITNINTTSSISNCKDVSELVGLERLGVDFNDVNSKYYSGLEVKGKLKIHDKDAVSCDGHSLALCSHFVCWSTGPFDANKINRIFALDGEYEKDNCSAQINCAGIYNFMHKMTKHKIMFVVLSNLDIFK